MGEISGLQGLNGSNILEVAIGLVFVFLLVSLFVSWVQEFIASLFSWRSKHMIEVIQVLLDPDDTSKVYETEGFFRRISQISSTPAAQVVERFYDSGIIKTLSKPNGFPSFIDPGDFANYVLDNVLNANINTGQYGIPQKINAQLTAIEVEVNKIANGKAREAIMSQINLAWKANETLEKRVAAARVNVTSWFDTTMDRADGWYKRRAQKIALLIAIVVVIVLNIDAIGMAWSFYNEPQIREFVLQEASAQIALAADAEIPQECSELTAESAKTACILDDQSTAILNQIDDLPIGWNLPTGLTTGWMNTERYDPNRFPPPTLIGGFYWVLKIVGLLVTAFAVSFGSTFWFEMLGKLVNMRLAGKKPKGNGN